MEDITAELIASVSAQVTQKKIELSPKTVMSVLTIAMEAVEGSPVKGPQQKDLAIKIVMNIAENANLPEDQLSVIKALIDGGFVADTIDLVVAASQGKLNVNSATQIAQGCFAKCLPFLMKKAGIKMPPAALAPETLPQKPSPAATPSPEHAQFPAPAQATSQPQPESQQSPVVMAAQQPAAAIQPSAQVLPAPALSLPAITPLSRSQSSVISQPIQTPVAADSVNEKNEIVDVPAINTENVTIEA
jgi:hypothetical protein